MGEAALQAKEVAAHQAVGAFPLLMAEAWGVGGDRLDNFEPSYS